MEFILLIGFCLVVVAAYAMFMRRRSIDVDDAGLAAKANADAERTKNDWYGSTS